MFIWFYLWQKKTNQSDWDCGNNKYFYFNLIAWSHFNYLFPQPNTIKLWIPSRPLWVNKAIPLTKPLPTCPFQERNFPTASPKACGPSKCKKRTWKSLWTQTKNFSFSTTYSNLHLKKTTNSPTIHLIESSKTSNKDLGLHQTSLKFHIIWFSRIK